MKVKIKQVHNDSTIPVYATDGSACFDLTACEITVFGSGKSAEIDTGLAFEIPQGWALELYSRSGHGFKKGWRLANGTGIIDWDYRGNVIIKLVSDREPIEGIKVGDRIAQGKLVPSPRVDFVVVDELSKTERGVGGFGSTGQ